MDFSNRAHIFCLTSGDPSKNLWMFGFLKNFASNTKIHEFLFIKSAKVLTSTLAGKTRCQNARQKIIIYVIFCVIYSECDIFTNFPA